MKSSARNVALGQDRPADAAGGAERRVMSGVDRSVLASLKPFAGWPAADLDALLAPAHARRYDKGAAVFEQGATANAFFLLLDGHVQASKLTPDGRQIVVRYINPGELFGIAAQIHQPTYPATAKAVVESLALAWPSSIWPELAKKFPALSAGLLESIGSRLSDANARVMEMATEPVERRLARAVLRLAARVGPLGRRRGRDRLPGDPPGPRRDDRHDAVHRQPAAQRLGERRPDRKRPRPHHRAPARPPGDDRRGRRGGVSRARRERDAQGLLARPVPDRTRYARHLRPPAPK